MEYKSCRACGYDDSLKMKVIVEYLYLDHQTCDRCIATESILDEVMTVLTPALRLAGFTVEYKKAEMETAEAAIQHQFVSSPTIRVNGQDICQSVSENHCGCCSDISEINVECRVFEYHGKTFEVPPKPMLAEGILRLIFGQTDKGSSYDQYQLPKNLKDFFIGKKNKFGCSCKGNCC